MNLLLLISNFVIISFMVRVQVLMDTIVAVKIEMSWPFENKERTCFRRIKLLNIIVIIKTITASEAK